MTRNEITTMPTQVNPDGSLQLLPDAQQMLQPPMPQGYNTSGQQYATQGTISPYTNAYAPPPMPFGQAPQLPAPPVAMNPMNRPTPQYGSRLMDSAFGMMDNNQQMQQALMMAQAGELQRVSRNPVANMAPGVGLSLGMINNMFGGGGGSALANWGQGIGNSYQNQLNNVTAAQNNANAQNQGYLKQLDGMSAYWDPASPTNQTQAMKDYDSYLGRYNTARKDTFDAQNTQYQNQTGRMNAETTRYGTEQTAALGNRQEDRLGRAQGMQEYKTLHDVQLQDKEFEQKLKVYGDALKREDLDRMGFGGVSLGAAKAKAEVRAMAQQLQNDQLVYKQRFWEYEQARQNYLSPLQKQQIEQQQAILLKQMTMDQEKMKIVGSVLAGAVRGMPSYENMSEKTMQQFQDSLTDTSRNVMNSVGLMSDQDFRMDRTVDTFMRKSKEFGAFDPSLYQGTKPVMTGSSSFALPGSRGTSDQFNLQARRPIVRSVEPRDPSKKIEVKLPNGKTVTVTMAQIKELGDEALKKTNDPAKVREYIMSWL